MLDNRNNQYTEGAVKKIMRLLRLPSVARIALDNQTISMNDLHEKYGDGFFIFGSGSTAASANITDLPAGVTEGFTNIRLFIGMDRYVDILFVQASPSRIYVRNKAYTMGAWYQVGLTQV